VTGAVMRGARGPCRPALVRAGNRATGCRELVKTTGDIEGPFLDREVPREAGGFLKARPGECDVDKLRTPTGEREGSRPRLEEGAASSHGWEPGRRKPAADSRNRTEAGPRTLGAARG